MLAQKLLGAMAGGAEDKLYVDDVFSAYTYTGSGSTQTITNGIDLAGEGGMVWTKCRSIAYQNALGDSERGPSFILGSDSTSAQDNYGTLVYENFLSTGYKVGSSAFVNQNTQAYVSWTFRKAPKFFDVVTYTGNGTTNNISHGLGVLPGFLIIKCTSHATNWAVIARVNTTDYAFFSSGSNGLNSTGAGTVIAMGAGMNSSTFNASWMQDAGGSTNESGRTYVAYLFAHDTSAEGIVQCGSFTTDGSGNATVDLGWEPQYVMVKRTDSSSAGDWWVMDTARGFHVVDGQGLRANTSGAEVALGPYMGLNSVGFSAIDMFGTNVSANAVYLAIRRPNKPPTTGTQVFDLETFTGTGANSRVFSGFDFAPDSIWQGSRDAFAFASYYLTDRLRGAINHLHSASTGAEISTASLWVSAMDRMNGYAGGTADFNQVDNSGSTRVHYAFKRAPGFFDVVCYTGTGSGNITVSHSLGVAPELVIVKKRNAAQGWAVDSVTSGTAGYSANLNAAFAANFYSGFPHDYLTAAPTTSNVQLSIGNGLNDGSATYVAYLFASLPGISKVGTHTGNGSSQTINCGFSAGARFVLIKRTDSTGDWYVWDTARGIVSANDPHLSLNSTAAEVTGDDSVDPDSTGFIVNQNATTNINVTSATYLYLAVS